MKNKTVMTGALVAALVTGAVGGSALNAINADAATPTTVNATSSAQEQTNSPQDGQFDPAKGGHIGANGKKEELLTGDTAEKVKAAALAKVPGGTIERVETDAEGAAYEAHMTKADGSRVTVFFDNSFNATSVEEGGPGGQRGQK